jgi:hypothetical protein
VARRGDAIARTPAAASEAVLADPGQASGGDARGAAQGRGTASAAGDPGDDAWLAMVAADPALYLKDDGMGTRGR